MAANIRTEVVPTAHVFPPRPRTVLIVEAVTVPESRPPPDGAPQVKSGVAQSPGTLWSGISTTSGSSDCAASALPQNSI